MTTWYYARHLDDPNAAWQPITSHHRVDHQWQANLEGSPNDSLTHSIVLDLDCPHEYRPSTTTGHGHLIIPARLPWWQYRHLLKILAQAGVISHGYLKYCLEHKASYVRAPGVYKPDGAGTYEAREQKNILDFRNRLLNMAHRLVG